MNDNKKKKEENVNINSLFIYQENIFYIQMKLFTENFPFLPAGLVGWSVDGRGQEMIEKVIVLDNRKNKYGKDHLVLYQTILHN